MAKLLNKFMMEELSNEVKGVNCFILFGYDKINSEQVTKFRSKLKEKNIKVRVLKNTIASLVFEKAFNKKFDAMLKGPIAMAYGGESPVDCAKAIYEWDRRFRLISIKGGYFAGQILNYAHIEELSKTPSKEVLLSMVAGMFQSPVQDVANVLTAAIQNMTYSINGLIEKIEKENPKS